MPNAIDVPEIYRGFSFMVEFPGFSSAGFQVVSGIEAAWQFEEIREVSNPFNATNLFAGFDSKTIVLEKGRTSNRDLLTWANEAMGLTQSAAGVKRTGLISILNPQTLEILSQLRVFNARPKAYATSDLKATETILVIQRLELLHEGIVDLGSPRPQPATSSAGPPSAASQGSSYYAPWLRRGI